MVSLVHAINNIVTMVEKRKKTDKIAIQSLTVPQAREQSERASEQVSAAEGRKQSEQSGASEQVSGASERANGRASGPVLLSVFLAVIDHSVLTEDRRPTRYQAEL